MKATMIIMFILGGNPQVSTLEFNSMYDCLKANVQISGSIYEGKTKAFDDEKRRCVPGSNFKLQ